MEVHLGGHSIVSEKPFAQNSRQLEEVLKIRPLIAWKFDIGKSYSLLINHFEKEECVLDTWIANIPGNDISKGRILHPFKYFNPKYTYYYVNIWEELIPFGNVPGYDVCPFALDFFAEQKEFFKPLYNFVINFDLKSSEEHYMCEKTYGARSGDYGPRYGRYEGYGRGHGRGYDPRYHRRRDYNPYEYPYDYPYYYPSPVYPLGGLFLGAALGAGLGALY